MQFGAALRQISVQRLDIYNFGKKIFKKNTHTHLPNSKLDVSILCQSVVERFKQINPKIIFSVSSVIYNGKKHEHKQKLLQVVNGII